LHVILKKGEKIRHRRTQKGRGAAFIGERREGEGEK